MPETPGSSASPVKATERESHQRDLIAVVAALVRELHPQRSRFIDVGPSSRIERDLGIDSLGRTELILRIERAFRVRLPAQTIGEAETVQDLVGALEQARPARERIALEPRQAPALPSVPAASEARTLVEVLEWHAARHPDRLHLTVLQDETTILGHADIRRTRHQSAQPGSRLDRPRYCPWRSRGLDAADQHRFFRCFLRHSLCRRHSRADLPSDAAFTDRGTSAPPDRHLAQRRRLAC